MEVKRDMKKEPMPIDPADMMMDGKYIPIIGLEIHVELNTKSKMFCQCEANYFGAEPNTHTCPVCLGMPGGLPVPNKKAIESTILLGKALGCVINNIFKFDRKHYFYPDLPKGYQISQYDEPIAEHGALTIMTDKGEKSFRIKRVHLEEDTGKSTHADGVSKIDYNRGGVPLVEIVTEPDFHNADDVKAFLEELQVIVRHLGIANADMEKGDMRLEPNISVQLVRKYPELPKYKVEVKNINSFKFVKKAVEYELDRHIEILESSQVPKQETRGYDSPTGTTLSQRSKEDAEDYRYFPEPDIPPFDYTDAYLSSIYQSMPALPNERVHKYTEKWGVKQTDAIILTRNKDFADLFEKVVVILDGSDHAIKDFQQVVANYMINKKIDPSTDPQQVADQIVNSSKPVETDMGALSDAVKRVVEANQKAVDDYRSGKNPNAVMFLMGQVMREMKGNADAEAVKSIIMEALK